MKKIALAIAVLILASCRSGGGDSGGGDISVNPGGVWTYIAGGDICPRIASAVRTRGSPALT